MKTRFLGLLPASLMHRPGVALRSCILNKFPNDSDASGEGGAARFESIALGFLVLSSN